MRSIIVNVEDRKFQKMQMIATSMGVSIGDLVGLMINQEAFNIGLDMMFEAVCKCDDIEDETKRKKALMKALNNIISKKQTTRKENKK